MTDRDDIDMQTWTRRAFADEPTAGSVGDTIGDDLARAHAGLTRRRRWTAGASGIAIAAVVGALVAAPDAWQPPFDGSPEVVDQPAPPSGSRVPMDLEPLSPAEQQTALDECVLEGDPSRMRVVYAWRLAVPDWVDWSLPYHAAMVAIDEARGRAWACEGSGASDNGLPGEAQPLYIFSGSGGSDCSSRFRVQKFYVARVSDDVARVEIRFGSADRPGPWRVSRAHNGYLVFGFWFDLPRDTDETYRVEALAYDVDGNPIESDDLTEQVDRAYTPQMIRGCQPYSIRG